MELSHTFPRSRWCQDSVIVPNKTSALISHGLLCFPTQISGADLHSSPNYTLSYWSISCACFLPTSKTTHLFVEAKISQNCNPHHSVRLSLPNRGVTPQCSISDIGEFHPNVTPSVKIPNFPSSNPSHVVGSQLQKGITKG